MNRKLLMAAALALVALTPSIGIGAAQASWGGHPGRAYHHGWGPRYYAYHVAPYYVGQPRCYATVYGTIYCE
ncbi:MAG TPA: hypothetical protein VGR91_08450 [Stellaceae bacterium]|nr:hypothetical protein [Stellaceae bacterium]